MSNKNKIKKVLTAGATVAMLGTSLISGAAAASFADYPAPFVKDGKFMSDAHIVVGANAKTMDVIGAIDIAASLQAAAVSSEPVKVSSTCSGSGVTLIGEAAPFNEGSDLLVLGEILGQVKQKFTEQDLPILLDSNNGEFEQTLSFNESSGEVSGGSVQHVEASVGLDFQTNDGEDIDEMVGDFLVFEKGSSTTALFEYQLTFQDDLDWTVESDGTDEQDELIPILGNEYNLVKTTVNTTSDEITLEFLGNVLESPTIKKLSEGADVNFDPDADVTGYSGIWNPGELLGGYEIRMSLDDATDTKADISLEYRLPGSDSWFEAELENSNNAADSDEITEEELREFTRDQDDPLAGDESDRPLFFVYLDDADERTDVFTADVKIGVDYLKLVDTEYDDSNFEASESVFVNNVETALTNGFVKIVASESGSRIKLDSINYRLGNLQEKVYVPENHGLRQYLTEYTDEANDDYNIDEMEEYGFGMIVPNWDIAYMGMSSADESSIVVEEHGGKKLSLEFTNFDGIEYDVEFLQFEEDGPIAWATEALDANDNRDDIDAFIYTEGNYSGGNITNSSGTPITTANEEDSPLIYEGDAFVVSSDSTPDRNVRSYILEYQSRPTSVNDDDIKLEGFGSGDSWSVDEQLTVNTVATSNVLGSGDFTRGGYTFSYYILNNSQLEFPMIVDLNADGDIAGDVAILADQHGMNMQLPSQSSNFGGYKLPGASNTEEFNLTFTMVESKFDERTADLTNKLNIDVTNTSTGDEDADFNSLLSDNAVANTFVNIFATDEDDNQFARDSYGSLFFLQDDGDADDTNNQVTVTVPAVQLSPQVFVTRGEVDRSESGSGTVMSEMVNRARVGMAITDTQAEARGLVEGDAPAANLIVVGGPCVNSVANALLGSPADCVAGIEDGVGYLSMAESGENVAVLVYGLNAADTVAASEELSRMAAGSSREGMSLEVDTASGSVSSAAE